MSLKIAVKVLFCFFLIVKVNFINAQKNDWENQNITRLNTTSPSSQLISYNSPKSAISCIEEESSNFKSLNGFWKFNWAKTVEERPISFHKNNQIKLKVAYATSAISTARLRASSFLFALCPNQAAAARVSADLPISWSVIYVTEL